MGDYRLNTYVHAVEVDDKGERTGREQVFGPDDNMSGKDNEWALAAISNPDVWAGDNVPERKPAPSARQDEMADLRARIAELEQEKADNKAPADEPDPAKAVGKPAAPRPRPTGKPAQ